MDRQRPRRPGFTLIEVLIAILIVALLVAILVPTLAAAFRKAREAQVTAEMNNIATSIASFRVTFDDIPPSRIILSEEGFAATLARKEFTTATTIPGLGANDTDMTYGQLAQRSLLYLKRFWPRANFNAGGHDFNNNGSNDGYYIISGSECLTFFLGGIPLNDGAGTVTGLSGFSKLPTDPFTIVAGSTNRTVPNYEFNTSRLMDLDGDGIPSYVDPIDPSSINLREYAYFSAYGVNSYDPNDVNALAKDAEYEVEGDTTSTLVERGFVVSFPPNSVISPAPNPYTSGNPSVNNIAWINSNSYQLICAGQDRLWGLGGIYRGTSTGSIGRLPIYSSDALAPDTDAGDINDDGDIKGYDIKGIRRREADNLTNFSNGRLD